LSPAKATYTLTTTPPPTNTTGTAGHVLDVGMRNIGITSDRLLGTKGYHFLDGPYVEYQLQPKQAELTAEELSTLPALLTTELRRLVQLDIPTLIEDIARESVAEHCKDDVLGIDLSSYPDVVRMVNVCNMYIPCGGTHIQSSREIGEEVLVTKIKKKKNAYKVSYTVSGM
jgi:Ser-tRNA(Ala) deacylase AlaX